MTVITAGIDLLTARQAVSVCWRLPAPPTLLSLAEAFAEPEAEDQWNMSQPISSERVVAGNSPASTGTASEHSAGADTDEWTGVVEAAPAVAEKDPASAARYEGLLQLAGRLAPAQTLQVGCVIWSLPLCDSGEQVDLRKTGRYLLKVGVLMKLKLSVCETRFETLVTTWDEAEVYLGT